MKLRLGTRASELAVTQSESVTELLRARGHEVELVRIRTTGDAYQGSLTKVQTLGVFAAELRSAILDGRCDFAVHSLKDLPTAEVPGLVIAAVPPRADARDALCAAGRSFTDLPQGATVGTGSPRRVAQLRALRPDLSFVDVRGNLGTRLARVEQGDLDAVILAVAGLRRIGRDDAIDDVLPILPAPGQGALALECRADNQAVVAALREVDDAASHLAVDAERAVLAGLGGGCAAPIAALAEAGQLRGGVFAVDGSAQVLSTQPLTPSAAEACVADLLAQGAAEVTDLAAARPSRLHQWHAPAAHPTAGNPTPVIGDDQTASPGEASPEARAELAQVHDDSSLWGAKTPLAGMHIALPREDGPLAEGLRAAGAEVTAAAVQRTISRPVGELTGDWVAFTSARAVAVCADQGVQIPPDMRVAAVGDATARATREAGYPVDLVPDGPSSGMALAEAFPPGEGTVVLPCSELAGRDLEDGLRAKGWQVERREIYTVVPVDQAPQELREAWDQGRFDVVVITSGSVATAVEKLLGWRRDIAVVAFGEPSRRALADQGVPVVAVATEQNAAGIARAVFEQFMAGKR